MKLRLRQIGSMLRLAGYLFAGALIIASITPSWAFAQTANNPWDEPVNLSHSGVATNPDLVIDSDGVVHVVWQDDEANFLYVQSDGSQWSAPEMTELNRLFRFPDPDEPVDPFQLANYSGPNPLFIASPNQRIFAFWITPEGRVLVSNVANQDFKNDAGWGSGRLVAPGAASFAATVDALGELHVAYIRTVDDDPDNPPGIYYTRSQTNGGDWSKPVMLYESPYFRTLAEGQAHLTLATAMADESLRVYVAWDNRPRKQVFLARSIDGGTSWEAPSLVAGSVPNSGLAGPFDIQVGATEKSVVLVWQNGQPGGACSQVFQSSRDGGASWSDPKPMVEELLGCAQSNQFVAGLGSGPDDTLFFLTETQSQVVLAAWNGLQWSQPQVQSILSGFEEPEIYTEVIMGCRRASTWGNELFVVGCDEGGRGDVWITSRDLGTNTSWFAPPVWSRLSPVTNDNPEMEAVDMVTTDDGSIHVFFIQHQERIIHYTYWNGELWSRLTPVLVLPDGEVGSPVAAAGPDNELFLVTSNNLGALYFSRATSGNAAAESQWSSPTQLNVGSEAEVGSVDIGLGPDGTVYVLYSVPVNEQRGIYLMQSKDRGATWSEPLQLFDGAAADFDIVGVPSLLTLEDGSLHIMWKQQSIQGDGVPQSLSLYYSRSEDHGLTFSDAAVLVEESVIWRQMVADSEGNLHLLWRPENSATTIWDQVSFDGGRSWQIPQGLPDQGASPAVMVDPAGNLHLIDAGSNSLDHWLWDGGQWQTETPLFWSLDADQVGPVDVLAATVNKQGKMLVLLGAWPANARTSLERVLLYSIRTLDNTPSQTTTEVATTPTELPPTATATAPAPEGLPTPDSTAASESGNVQDQTEGGNSSGRTSPLTIALVPVALLLLSVLGLMIRRSARTENRKP